MSSKSAELSKFAFDTNVFIDSLKSAAAAAALEDFLRRALVVTYLSSVVVQELLAGATTRAAVRALERGIIAPFDRRGRIVTPSATAFSRSGRILAAIVARDGIDAIRGNRSLPNDTLLAASCREAGLTLISSDADFDRIRPLVPGLRVVGPWP